jgi:hypothetical protein
MSEFEPKYFDAGPAISAIGQADYAIGDAGIRNVPSLRYSSPWPWIRALTISITMWAFLAWLVSGYF